MGRGVAQIRNDDQQRLQCILNDKERLFGVDVDALNNQVADKAEQHAHRRSADLAYAEKEEFRGRRVTELQDEAERHRRELALDCAQFWKERQKKTMTREWDLNRRDQLRIDLPGRIGDDDPRCGVSSLQKFDGEDLGEWQRKVEQREDNRTNWLQQQEEHRQSIAEKRDEEKRDSETRRQQDNLREVCAKDADHEKRKATCSTAAANQKLAETRHQNRCREVETERKQNAQELQNMHRSPFLNEILLQKARKECWKGMQTEELRAIAVEQRRQCDDKQQKCHEEKQKILEASLKEAEIQRRAFSAARRSEILRRQKSKDVAAMLKTQMSEKLQRDDARNALYSNYVSPEYFAQFQTSHR